MRESFSEHMRRERLARKRKKYSLLAGLAILCASFGLYFLFQVDSVQRSYLYPYPYQGFVKKYAMRYHVDSNLAAAVIQNESKFRIDVHSHRGAIGLMQLMPDTADWIAVQLDDRSFSIEKLHEPETNIRYGIWYLSSLEQEFEGNYILILAAYNAGRGNVKAWMEEYGWGMDFHDIDEIPYAETRQYVYRVLRSREKYEKLYRDEEGS